MRVCVCVRESACVRVIGVCERVSGGVRVIGVCERVSLCEC